MTDRPILQDPFIKWLMRAGMAAMLITTLARSGETQAAAEATMTAATRPLFRDFMALNGHFTFQPERYIQVCRIARNYHNLNWDVKRPGDRVTPPVCVNKVNWNENVYGKWKKAGFDIDICIQFSGFEAKTPDYRTFWQGQERWCYEYGKAVASYYGPSGAEKLCSSIEIGNEPGAKFDQTLYRTIFKQMAQGMRDGDPKLKILTPTVHARPGDDYSQDLRGIYAAKDILPLYDVINVHTYPQVERKSPKECPWTRSYPEDPELPYLKVIDEVVAWRDENARGKEIWVTEFGYDACTPEAMKNRRDWALKLDWQGVTDLQQAQYLVRSFFAFAERDVRRAFVYYYDDNNEPGVHACSGLTRKFVPKMSFWAVRQLYQTLGEYRFKRIVKKDEGRLCAYEFVRDGENGQTIWAVWSPTGARTDRKNGYQPREATVTLTDLPATPTRVVGMATADGEAPKPAWEKAGPASITLKIGESPIYLIMGP